MLSDLACIVAKALEKEPNRRYESIESLARDLRRLLHWEPIEARRPTMHYRVSRYVRRHVALVAGAAVLTFAVALGVVGLWLGLVEAGAQRDEAILQRDAQRAINSFLTDDLLAAASPERAGADVTAFDLLNRASQGVDTRFADRPFIAASIHRTLGEAYATLGSFDDAEGHFNRAIELFTAFAGADSPELVRTQISDAGLFVRREQFADADRVYPEIIDRARLILGPDAPELYATLNDYGVALDYLDRPTEAIALLEESLRGRTRLLGARHMNSIITTSNLAQAYERSGDIERALSLLERALADALQLEPSSDYLLLGLNNNLGAMLQDLDRNEEAAPYIRASAEAAERVLGPDHPATLTIQANLAGLEVDLGDPLKAIELYQQVADKRASLYGEDSFTTIIAEYGVWNATWSSRQFDRAVAGYMGLLERLPALIGEDHWLTVQTRSSLARALIDAGRAHDALPMAQQAVRQFSQLFGEDHFRTKAARTILDDAQANAESVDNAE